MAPETEWKFVAVAPRHGDLKGQVAEMLHSSGLEGVAEDDIKIDTICARGHGEDSVRLWVRSSTKPKPGGALTPSASAPLLRCDDGGQY